MNDTDNDAAALDDARALLDAFIENDWSSASIRTNGREFSFSRDAALGGLGASAHNSIGAAEVTTAAQPVTAPHVGTVTSLAPVGTAVARGETIVSLSVLEDIIDVPAPCEGRIVSHGAEAGTLVEFGQVLIELAP